MARFTSEEILCRMECALAKIFSSVSYLFILCILFIERILDLLGLTIEALSHLFRLIISLLELLLLKLRFICWLFRFLGLQVTLGILLIALSCACYWPHSEYAVVLSQIFPAWTVAKCYWIITSWTLVITGITIHIALKIWKLFKHLV